jgi:hypothetical protein
VSGDAKLLLLYYFTSPHKNMAGVFHCPVAYTSDEIGLDPETVRGLLLTLKDFITFDPETDEVFVHGLAESAIGDELKAGDTKRKTLERHLRGIHSTRLLHLFQQRYAQWGLKVAIPEQRQPPPDTPADTPPDTPADTKAVEEQKKNLTEPRTSLVELHSTPAVSLSLVKSGHPARSLTEIQSRLAAFLGEAVQDGHRRVRLDEWRKVAASLVFAYWAAKTGHTRALLDPKRESILVRGLRDNGDNPHELLYVVDGALKDDWTMGRDPRSTKRYDGIETLFKDRAHVEKFAGLCQGYKDGKPHPMAVKHLGETDVA